MTINTLRLRINPEYKKLVPELSDIDSYKLKNSIKKEGLRERIIVNQDNIILDGHHRYRFCLELDIPITEKNIDIRHFDDKLKEIDYVFSTNLERRQYNTFQRCQAGYNFKPYFEEEAKKRMSQGGKGGLDFQPPLNRTRDSIADKVGVNSQTYWYSQSILEKNYSNPENYTEEETQTYAAKYKQLIAELVNDRKGIESSYDKIQKWDELIELEREKNKPKEDPEILESLGITAKPYDVWNIAGLDDRFGIKHPGNIPAEIVFNTLYFFTKQGDLVVDPMAGGGVVGDVCKIMRRECKMYDIQPVREDIQKWDITIEELSDKNPDLVFWDPPYFKKMEADYGETSISALTKDEYIKIFSNSAKKFHKDGVKKIAFLMSDYDDEYNDRPQDNIFIHDYIREFEKANWRVLRIIQCPLSTQQVRPSTAKNYLENRKLARISRNLVMFGRR